MVREELLKSPDYWIPQIQLVIYNAVIDYLEDNKMTKDEFVQKTGISRKMMKDIMSGDFNGRISDLVKLETSMGYVPKLELEPNSKAEDVARSYFLKKENRESND